MTEYKKEAPQISTVDVVRTVKEPVRDVAYYLSVATLDVERVQRLVNCKMYDDEDQAEIMSKICDEVIDSIRKAWDLVPECQSESQTGKADAINA